MQALINKSLVVFLSAILVIVSFFVSSQNAVAAGDDYFSQQTYLIDLQDFSEELKEINFHSPTILQLSDGSYVAVGGYEDLEQGPWSSDRVIFFTLESGIYRESRLPGTAISTKVFEIDGDIFVFGGYTHLYDPKSFDNGQVNRYVESTNSFVVDSIGPSYGIAQTRYFQIDGHVRRVVMPITENRYSEATDGRVETYHTGLGWTAKEVPVAEIQTLYYDILQRAPDSDGLNYWCYQYSQGMTLAEIESAFLNSDEYKKSFGNQDIAQLYREILNREPDYDGLSYWTFHYNRGMSLVEIREQFLLSDEYKHLQTAYSR